jgi:hypothetical protein
VNPWCAPAGLARPPRRPQPDRAEDGGEAAGRHVSGAPEISPRPPSSPPEPEEREVGGGEEREGADLALGAAPTVAQQPSGRGCATRTPSAFVAPSRHDPGCIPVGIHRRPRCCRRQAATEGGWESGDGGGRAAGGQGAGEPLLWGIGAGGEQAGAAVGCGKEEGDWEKNARGRRIRPAPC